MRAALFACTLALGLGAALPAHASCTDNAVDAVVGVFTGGISCGAQAAMDLLDQAQRDARDMRNSAAQEFNEAMSGEERILTEARAAVIAQQREETQFGVQRRLRLNAMQQRLDAYAHPAAALSPRAQAQLRPPLAGQTPTAPALRNAPSVGEQAPGAAPVATAPEVSLEYLIGVMQELTSGDADRQERARQAFMAMQQRQREATASQHEQENRLRRVFDTAVTATLDGVIASIAVVDPAGAAALYASIRATLDGVQRVITVDIRNGDEAKRRELDDLERRQQQDIVRERVEEEELKLRLEAAERLFTSRSQVDRAAYEALAGRPASASRAAITNLEALRLTAPRPSVLFAHTPAINRINALPLQAPAGAPPPSRAVLEAAAAHQFDLAFRNQPGAVAAARKAAFLQQAGAIRDAALRVRVIAAVQQAAAERGAP
jgi:hypothetical protein